MSDEPFHHPVEGLLAASRIASMPAKQHEMCTRFSSYLMDELAAYEDLKAECDDLRAQLVEAMNKVEDRDSRIAELAAELRETTEGRDRHLQRRVDENAVRPQTGNEMLADAIDPKLEPASEFPESGPDPAEFVYDENVEAPSTDANA